MHASIKSEMAALSRLFSPRVIRELGETGHSSLLARLLIETGIPRKLAPDATLADAFSEAFAALRKMGNRDDYVYRVALTQKIALGRHSLHTATVLNELRAGKSKADLVILNGTATAYEIKSERDSFNRLPEQLADYRSVFACVNVVTSPMQADAVLDLIPDDVGVLRLSKRFTLQVVRQATESPERTDPLAILDTLRTKEAIELLKNLGMHFPQVPNTQRWSALREIYAGLDPATVHMEAVRVLKRMRSRAGLVPFLQQLPTPLRTAALAADLSASARSELSMAAWLPLTTVLAWSDEQNVLPILSR